MELHSSLRCQAKNLERFRGRWFNRPQGEVVNLEYTVESQATLGIIGSFESKLPFGPDARLDLPNFPDEFPADLIPVDKPLVVFRPSTLRKEWFNSARSPKAGYLTEVVNSIPSGYHVLALADLAKQDEYLEEPLPERVDQALLKGDLHVEALIETVRAATFTVGSPGFLLPMAMATERPMFCIVGGQGALNGPQALTDQRFPHKVTFAVPEPLCLCRSLVHECTKEIPELGVKFASFLDSLNDSLAPQPTGTSNLEP